MPKLLIKKTFIRGIPYGQDKVRGDTSAPKKWTDDVIRQTKNMPKINGSCEMLVTFVLPLNKYPPDHPYGSDLDNLLKRFQDALNNTIFAEVQGKDGCVIRLHANKIKTEKEEAGAWLEISAI